MAQVRLPGNHTDVTAQKKTILRQHMEDRSKLFKYDVPHAKYDGTLFAIRCCSQSGTTTFRTLTEERLELILYSFRMSQLTRIAQSTIGTTLDHVVKRGGSSSQDNSVIPLIDHQPADPDTIKTAIEQDLSGDDASIFTCDPQL